MSDELRHRDPRDHDPKYLAFIAGLPCVACMVGGKYRRGVHVAHLREGSLEHEKRPTGLGEKPSDIWTTPLCPPHHVNGNTSQHHLGEADFWRGLAINPFDLCIALRAAYEAGQPGFPVISHFAAQAMRIRAW